jgi:hypothetical protein
MMVALRPLVAVVYNGGEKIATTNPFGDANRPFNLTKINGCK